MKRCNYSHMDHMEKGADGPGLGFVILVMSILIGLVFCSITTAETYKKDGNNLEIVTEQVKKVNMDAMYREKSALLKQLVRIEDNHRRQITGLQQRLDQLNTRIKEGEKLGLTPSPGITNKFKAMMMTMEGRLRSIRMSLRSIYTSYVERYAK